MMGGRGGLITSRIKRTSCFFLIIMTIVGYMRGGRRSLLNRQSEVFSKTVLSRKVQPSESVRFLIGKNFEGQESQGTVFERD